MKKLITIFAVAGLVLALAPAAEAAVTFEEAATAKHYTYASSGTITVASFDSANPTGGKLLGDVTSLTGVENYTACTYLRLDNNQISSIESGAFTGLSVLETLSLYNNQITSIASGDFTGLSALTRLYLARNQITSIESGAFTGLSALTRLDLYRNQITSIESGNFTGLSALTSLDLDNNQITSIESGDFTGLSALEELSLNDNQITSIGANAFTGLSNLAELVIGTGDGTNPLVSIGDNAFDGCTSLETLVMAEITTLATLNLTGADFGDDFNIQLRDTTGLTGVDLTGASLTQGAFDGLMDPQGGNGKRKGLGDLAGIMSMVMDSADLSGVTDLSTMFLMDDLVTLSMPYATLGDIDFLDDLVSNLALLDGLTLSDTQWDAMSVGTQGNLTAWDAEVGNTLTTVPEPATLCLLGLGGLVLRRRRNA